MRQPFISEIMKFIESQDYADQIPKRFYDAFVVLYKSNAIMDFCQLNETFMTVEERQMLIDSYNLPLIPKTLALYVCGMEDYRRIDLERYEVMICKNILKYRLI